MAERTRHVRFALSMCAWVLHAHLHPYESYTKLGITLCSFCFCSCDTFCSDCCEKQRDYDESHISDTTTLTINAIEKQSNDDEQ